MQTALKLLPRLLRSSLPRRVKIESVFHLTANVGYVLMVALALLIGPAVWLRRGIGARELAVVDLPSSRRHWCRSRCSTSSSQREAYGQLARGGALRPGADGRRHRHLDQQRSRRRRRPLSAARRSSDAHPKYALARGEARRSRPEGTAHDAGSTRGSSWPSASTSRGSSSPLLASGLWGAVPFLDAVRRRLPLHGGERRCRQAPKRGVAPLVPRQDVDLGAGREMRPRRRARR